MGVLQWLIKCQCCIFSSIR